MRHTLFFLFCFILNSAIAQDKSIGVFQSGADIGNPKNPGAAQYNSADQVYSMKGSGYNIWFSRDEFHYLYNTIKGDFILTANFRFEGKGTDPHRKTGWMLRASTDEKSLHISAVLHGDGLTVLQWRDFDGAEMKIRKMKYSQPVQTMRYYSWNAPAE
jgi:hypothetical protein